VEAVDEIEQIEPIEVITFRVTAYCACEKCCGKWAKLRPLDSYGNPIVRGAAGTVLATGISCASPYPFGTEINLDGFGTVIVEDRTAGWVVDKYGENIIDIYFDNHQTAKEFGVKYIEGVVLE
jgi:3D (Asp-Asp-Asp) domain-containing protein